MSYEQGILVEKELDQRIVEATLADLGAFIDAQENERFDAATLEAKQFITGLYDTYAPEINSTARMIGTMLGAAGLVFLAERFGADDMHPKMYSGTHEREVLATFHHVGHSRDFIEAEFAYAQKVNQVTPGTYGPSAFMRFPVIGSLHDGIMGNGRGNDERQSGQLGGQLLCALGMSLTPDEPIKYGIGSTAWKEKIMEQSFDPQEPYVEYQLASCTADLLPLHLRGGPRRALGVISEDMCKQMNDRVLVREAKAAGFVLARASVETCYAFMDTSETLREVCGQKLRQQKRFFETFKPADERLDAFFPGRSDNIDFLGDLCDAHDRREPGTVLLEMAREYEQA